MSEDVHGHGDAHMSRSDIRLYKSAISRFDIPKEKREALAAKAIALAETTKSEDFFIKASGLVLKMDEINVKREALEQSDAHHHEGGKLQITGKLSVNEMTDDELAAIASGSSQGIVAAPECTIEPA